MDATDNWCFMRAFFRATILALEQCATRTLANNFSSGYKVACARATKTEKWFNLMILMYNIEIASFAWSETDTSQCNTNIYCFACINRQCVSLSLFLFVCPAPFTHSNSFPFFRKHRIRMQNRKKTHMCVVPFRLHRISFTFKLEQFQLFYSKVE